MEMKGVPKKYLKGYPSLAAFIASDSYNSTAIYRQFKRLSARNLLHLQSELMQLEALQDSLDRDDLQSSTLAKSSARDWQTLTNKATEWNNAREKERLDVVLEIRYKLREYSLSRPSSELLSAEISRESHGLGKFRSFPKATCAADPRCLQELLL